MRRILLWYGKYFLNLSKEVSLSMLEINESVFCNHSWISTISKYAKKKHKTIERDCIQFKLTRAMLHLYIYICCQLLYLFWSSHSLMTQILEKRLRGERGGKPKTDRINWSREKVNGAIIIIIIITSREEWPFQNCSFDMQQ